VLYKKLFSRNAVVANPLKGIFQMDVPLFLQLR